jgi:hypothetical protein
MTLCVSVNCSFDIRGQCYGVYNWTTPASNFYRVSAVVAVTYCEYSPPLHPSHDRLLPSNT